MITSFLQKVFYTLPGRACAWFKRRECLLLNNTSVATPSSFGLFFAWDTLLLHYPEGFQDMVIILLAHELQALPTGEVKNVGEGGYISSAQHSDDQ
jgi:hypothetical protein